MKFQNFFEETTTATFQFFCGDMYGKLFDHLNNKSTFRDQISIYDSFGTIATK